MFFHSDAFERSVLMQIRFLIDFSYIIVAFVVIGACVDAMALPIPIWIVLRLVVFLGRYSIL